MDSSENDDVMLVLHSTCWDRLFQAEDTFPMEIVSIHGKTNRATSLEFVKSIVPEPINKAIAKPAAII